MRESNITVGQNILQLIAEIDEFKGQWQALKNTLTRTSATTT